MLMTKYFIQNGGRKMKFKVRRVMLKDRKRINELATELQDFHRKEMPDIFTKPTSEWSEEEFTRIIEDTDRNYMVLAENEEGIIAGFTYIQILEQVEDEKLDKIKIAYYSMIYIEEEFRKFGVGRMLKDDTDRYAKDLKAKGIVDRIEVRVWEFNEGSRKFIKDEHLRPLYTVYEMI